MTLLQERVNCSATYQNHNEKMTIVTYWILIIKKKEIKHF